VGKVTGLACTEIMSEIMSEIMIRCPHHGPQLLLLLLLLQLYLLATATRMCL